MMAERNHADECSAIEDRLIDYADGVLRGAEAATIRAHVDGCAACRREVAAMRRSLMHARTVWRQSAAELAARRRARHRVQSIGWLVAGTAAVVAVMFGWNLVVSTPDPTMVGQAMPEIDEIEAYLQREEQIARLMMSARMLAEVPDAREELARAKEYLESTYGVSLSDAILDEDPFQQGT